VATAADDDQARQLRDAMTDTLVKRGAASSPAIEAAFRAASQSSLLSVSEKSRRAASRCRPPNCWV
jgi:hypothetical protein